MILPLFMIIRINIFAYVEFNSLAFAFTDVAAVICQFNKETIMSINIRKRSYYATSVHGMFF